MQNSITIGNYRIESELARGSTGRVYLVRHRHLTSRIAAMKLLYDTYLNSAEDYDRFLHEARILERLSHRYILPILDFGSDEGIPYLVTEYAPNGSLRDLLDSYRPHLLPIDMSMTILTQIGEALDYAHQKKVLHLDLKPENILFNAHGEAMLADFSISLIQSTAQSIHTTDVMGTPPYMPPEQFRGRVDKQSDLYALACIAYEVFTGQMAFPDDDYATLMFKHEHEYPTPPTLLNPYLSSSIEEVITTAMQKRRINRYPDVLTFIGTLQDAFLSHQTKEHWLKVGIRLRQLGRFEEALTADMQAIRLDPTFAPAFHNMGNTLFSLGYYKNALAAYEQAIRLAPGIVQTHHYKGRVLQLLDRTADAQRAYQKARQLGYRE